MPTHSLHHFEHGHCPLDVLHLATDVFYETSGNSGFDPLANEELRILILVDVLRIETI